MKTTFLVIAFMGIVALRQDLFAEGTVPKKTYSAEEFTSEVNKKVLIELEKYKKKDIVVLIEELMQKEKKLKDSELSLKQKESLVKRAEKELQAEIEKFNQNKSKLLGCVESNQKKEQGRVDQMISVYSNMKPAKAAEVLSVQDADLAVKILSGMDPVKVSKVFNLMDKEISARLQKQFLLMKK